MNGIGFWSPNDDDGRLVTNDIAQPDTDQDPHHPRLRPAVSPPPPRQGGPGEAALDIYTYLQIDIYNIAPIYK